MKKMGTGTYKLANPVYLNAFGTIVGEQEKKGPLGPYFDLYNKDEYFGQESFERAEIFMQKEVISHVLKKTTLSEKDIDLVFAGDLLNQ